MKFIMKLVNNMLCDQLNINLKQDDTMPMFLNMVLAECAIFPFRVRDLKVK